MAFKMKGFPYKSGFKHADSGHSEKDHQHIQASTETPGGVQSEKTTETDVNKEIKYLKSEIERLTKYLNSGKYSSAQNRSFEQSIQRMQGELAKLSA
jgi:hypothetical protein